MLNNMRHHLKYECLQDPEIFNTIVPNPEYKFFGSFNNGVLRGMKEVKDFYYNMWNSHSSLIELEIHHCSPGDWGVACDGEWYQQVPGKVLIEQGDKTVDPDKWYLSHAHLSWFFPFEDINGEMLLGGEICYIDETGSSLDELDSKDILTLEGARNSWPN
tara:strand:+ start:855 stop:1334 length:480 start_codon:yes stop_codon:yes gene_type:complete